MEYDNTNSGALFVNDNKTKDSQPDYKGNFTDGNGVEFWVSGWKKVSKNGSAFLSLSFTPKNEQVAAAKPQMADIPF